jgi:hypothetical protein
MKLSTIFINCWVQECLKLYLNWSIVYLGEVRNQQGNKVAITIHACARCCTSNDGETMPVKQLCGLETEFQSGNVCMLSSVECVGSFSELWLGRGTGAFRWTAVSACRNNRWMKCVTICLFVATTTIWKVIILCSRKLTGFSTTYKGTCLT